MSQGRKADHLRICSEMDVEFRARTTWLEHVELVHEALPELSYAEIDTRARFMGRTLRAPLVITAISGGVAAAKELNKDLARAAQEMGVAFGLGSQRPMLDDPSLIDSYAVRRWAPDVPILGNIGLQQAAAADPADLARLVSSIEADGLAVHLNPAQELSQAEGDKDFRGGLKALKALCRRLPGKVMVKETGCGVSRETARRLKAAGVRCLDVAGAGGTSWPRVENLRKAGRKDGRPAGPGGASNTAGGAWIEEWGIPTAASLWEAAPLGLALVGSGGVRGGLDAAKCLALGADAAGLALPVLRAWKRGGHDGVVRYLQGVVAELKSVMLLVGARDVASLRKSRTVITGRLREWINSRR